MKTLFWLYVWWLLVGVARASEPTVVVETVAGSGSPGYLDGRGIETFLNLPTKIVVTKSQQILFYDSANFRVRTVSPDFTVTTFAGSGLQGYQDGPSTNAAFGYGNGYGVVVDMVLDSASNLIIVDGNRIRKITPQGLVTTVAGSQQGFRDGLGNDALFSFPRIAIDGTDTLFIADEGNHRIRKMDKSGMVTTLAGSGNSGFTDGIGIFAAFSDPKAIAVDLAGNLLVFDGSRLRTIDPTGKVSTRTDLTAILADYAIGSGNQLTIDSAGSIYIATASRILKIFADGRVTTAAGGSNSGFQDGPVLSAKFCQITGFAFDKQWNNLYCRCLQ